MDAYGHLFEHVLFPVWEGGLRGRPTLQRLRYLEQTQWRSRDEIEAIRTSELRQLLKHAQANVPYYREQFAAAGLDAGDVRELRSTADLMKFPVLEHGRARDTVAERTATIGPRIGVHKGTSGTMGRPLVFGYERSSESWRQAVRIRGYGWSGYRLGQRSLHYWGAGPPRAKNDAAPTMRRRLRELKQRADHAIRRQEFMDCGRRGAAELDAVVERIRRDPPEIIVCYSQAGADLARHVNETGRRSWGTIPVICGAERLLPADREALVQAFGPSVFETYGCREFMLIAAECAAHDGLHTSMETLVVELLVRENGNARPARPGETGEVVITDLTNHAMPFIRYANGDCAIAGKEETCGCGRTLPRLAGVDGRVTETLVDLSGARINGLVFNVVIAHIADAIQRFQVVQHRDRTVTLRIVPTARYDAGAESTLVRTWSHYVPSLPVRIERVDQLPIAATGKRQVVVVER
jgi:phenylacetate-CoA ligase